eukprot:TRINITY_DN57605_c0_g1_i1.p1 TRINITY_DN57605_c0_g1~~TRINITY_DN57605_c0_g1_i1.p1  ORF type:complete len:248 (+),score=49.93 TRINITY_DN57605_c0_g1_i1:96-839(+)
MWAWSIPCAFRPSLFVYPFAKRGHLVYSQVSVHPVDKPQICKDGSEDMKNVRMMILFLVVFSAASALAADGFPTTLAGFTLGTDVKRYADLCALDKAIPVSDDPFLSEALLKEGILPGVRGGSLAFGNSMFPGKLVRIKLKFHEKDQGLFNKLHSKYLTAFGEPDQYLGDAFKNVIAWEWQFKNGKGEEISLVLMWSRDQDVRPGVSIKMTNKTLMDAEYQRYMEDSDKRDEGGATRIRSLDTYVPR